MAIKTHIAMASLRALLHKSLLCSSDVWLQRTVRTHRAIASHASTPRERIGSRQGRAQQQRPPRREAPQRDVLVVTEPTHQGPPLMILKAGKSRLFYEGAPTVYGGAVDRIVAAKQPKTGEAMLVLDANMKLICWGVFNSISMFCLRILQWRSEMGSADPGGLDETDLARVIDSRVQAAVQLRQMIGLPSEDTTVFRLINSEGDRLSGLVVDVYGTCAVAACSAAWVELNKDAVVAALKRQAGVSQVVWRPALDMLKLEGITPERPAEAAEGSPVHQVTEGEDERRGNDRTEPAAGGRSHQSVLENGVAYRVDLRHGQKTGFYADQRDSRALVKALSRGKQVLDLCTYTGGFALAAAAGGAIEALGVDSSASAIRLAEENAGLGPETQVARFERAEVEPFMRQAAQEGRLWDIVVLDPPKLAPNKKALERAKQKYVKLNAAAMRLVAPGGLLMTCSCSGAVAQADGLLPMVKEAAALAGRMPTLIRSAGAALDHPLDPAYPEGRYLTNLLLRLD